MAGPGVGILSPLLLSLGSSATRSGTKATLNEHDANMKVILIKKVPMYMPYACSDLHLHKDGGKY